MEKIKNFIIHIVYETFFPLFFELVYIRDKQRIHKTYGKPKKLKDRNKWDLIFRWEVGESNENGRVYPELVYMIESFNEKIGTVILDGDPNIIVDQIKKGIRNLRNSKFVTVGLEVIETDSLKIKAEESSQFNYIWDFEQDPPPGIPKADLIISQAMIEHLLRPYKHLKDLSELLNKDGHMVVHTVLPGYSYHRFPIDTLRYYPDWFEETAKRLGLKVVEKYQHQFHIFYHYKKP